MLLQPGVAPALAGGVYLVPQTAQGKSFVSAVGQLTNGIIYLHFQTLAMRLIYISLHRIVRNKRVVNVWINRRTMMYIDNGCACCLDGIDIGIFMIKAGGPLKIGIDGMERRDEQGEIVI